VYERYLRLLAVLVALGALTVAGVNLLVDPFSVFGMPRIRGLNAEKPGFVEHLRLTNTYAPYRLRPTCLIIGTSRAGRGLSPAHPGFRGQRCYNIALPAIDAYEMQRYFQHAHAIAPLRQVVLALDFRVFHGARDESGAFSEARFAVDADGAPNIGRWAAMLSDGAASLLSTDALLASVRTVRTQGWSSIDLAENGQWVSTADRGNYAEAFRAYTANTFARFDEFRRAPFDLERAGAPLRRILALAHRDQVDLRLVISPSHAWHWEAMRMAGLWERFEAIKRFVVTINREEAARAGRAPFPLWDFSGYDGPNAEEVPLPGHGADRMQWYWEPVHYKTALGDRVLSAVLDHPPQSGVANLGTPLTDGNLEAHLAWIRLTADRFAAAQSPFRHVVRDLHAARFGRPHD
jgi:hypothetical protein